MDDRTTYEAQFLTHLPWMRRAMTALCHRHHVHGADAEDCASWTLLRVLEHDYAVLRKFRGESSVRTYLTVVLATLHKEYRVHHWGRWRPSSAARRAGPVAVRLETLVYRDGYPLAEAIALLRLTDGADVAGRSDRELATLFATLPSRVARRGRAGRVVGELTDDVLDARDDAHPEELLLAAEAREEARRLEEAIAGALAGLPAEDREIVRLRFWEGMTVADIARTCGLPQKPLYRRMERALRQVRAALVAAGRRAA